MEINSNRKRSVLVFKKRTSICLEDSFWHSLLAIVRIENTTVGDFVEKIAVERNSLNLSSSLRVAVLQYFQQLAVSSIAVRRDMEPAVLGCTADAIRDENNQEEALERLTSFWKRVKRRRISQATQPDRVSARPPGSYLTPSQQS